MPGWLQPLLAVSAAVPIGITLKIAENEDKSKVEALEKELAKVDEQAKRSAALGDPADKEENEKLLFYETLDLTEAEKAKIRKLMESLIHEFWKAMKQLEKKQDDLGDKDSKARLDKVRKNMLEWLEKIKKGLKDGIAKDDVQLLKDAWPDLDNAGKTIDSIVVKNLKDKVPELNDANTPKARAEVLKAKLALSEEWIAKILKKLQEVDPKFEEEKKTPKPQVAFFKTNKGWWVGFSLCLLALFVSIGGVVWLWIMLRRNHSDTSSASQSVGSV